MQNKVNPNDYNEYLNTASEKTVRKVSEGKGSKKPAVYGSGKGTDNKKYMDRGMQGSPDDKKLESQKLPNNRNADYFAGY